MVLDNGDEGVVCSVNTGADLRGESKLLVLPRVTPGDDGAPGDDARRGEGDAADGRSRRNVGVPRRRGVLADGSHPPTESPDVDIADVWVSPPRIVECWLRHLSTVFFHKERATIR